MDKPSKEILRNAGRRYDNWGDRPFAMEEEKRIKRIECLLDAILDWIDDGAKQ